MRIDEIEQPEEEFADTRKRPAMTRAMAQRIARDYRKRQAEGRGNKYSQMIAGKEHRDFGQAKNSWLTGTASWNFAAISQHILGVRPEYDGLRVDPCIPRSWKGFTVTRVFRGDTYHISIANPRGLCRGIRCLEVDGSPMNGNIVPSFGDGAVHRVEGVLE